ERLCAARREARWSGGLLLVNGDDLPTGFHWSTLWTELEGLSHPPLLALPPHVVEVVAATASVEPVVIDLSNPSLDTRLRLWRALLPSGESIEDSLLETLAGRFRFTPGRIARVVRRAQAEASLRPAGHQRLTPETLERACRAVGAAAMG